MNAPEVYLIRFVLKRRHSDTGVGVGAFVAAYNLLGRDELPPDDRQALSDLLDWFKKSLVVPPRFNRTKSKSYYRRTNTGISWFKSGATRHLAQMRQIREILERNGVSTEAITVNRPGYVIYEDEHQTVAEPFKEKRVSRARHGQFVSEHGED